MNQAGMGAKALLAKRMAKTQNPTYTSPTDNLMTPCTQKISAAKKKHFTKGPKPMHSLFPQKESSSSDGNVSDESTSPVVESLDNKMNPDDNPF